MYLRVFLFCDVNIFKFYYYYNFFNLIVFNEHLEKDFWTIFGAATADKGRTLIMGFQKEYLDLVLVSAFQVAC